ncbi:sulfotransferase [Yoonia vestfoldensis]|uniref:Sulfotransferase family protein n=1 Tax=Yoonia vestfoldensis TaxID=245188 RepID=A0A1Y0EC99_9RHOB|nr:sulfotransferase [Yoonia vestfoldensis]ARU01118.1 sulfotransferase family protein [Yoonia vestfoldensis]
MPDPAILYCVGATKAGTSWFYRLLHDHPDCALPAVKEAHYWDTFAAADRAKQLAAFDLRLQELRAARAEAVAADRGWQIRNLDRRIADMTGLIAVLAGDRRDDVAYLDWLTQGRGTARLYADMTPNYATLPDAQLERMVTASPLTKVIYLIRDPLDRLWSHIRMQAHRQRQSHEIYEKKANNILFRMLNRGQETHILARGDYAGVIEKLRRVVPADRLMVAFAETLLTPEGLARVCAFLGIAPVDVPAQAVHDGRPVLMLEKLRPRAQKLVFEQYDWVARNVGPLPQNWQDNCVRMTA